MQLQPEAGTLHPYTSTLCYQSSPLNIRACLELIRLCLQIGAGQFEARLAMEDKLNAAGVDTLLCARRAHYLARYILKVGSGVPALNLAIFWTF